MEMKNILDSIPDYEYEYEYEDNHKITLTQIKNINPEYFTIDEPLTYILYLEYNPNLNECERKIVIDIITKLKKNKEIMNKHNEAKMNR